MKRTLTLLTALLLMPLANLHAADCPLQRRAGVPSSHPYSEMRQKTTEFSESARVTRATSIEGICPPDSGSVWPSAIAADLVCREPKVLSDACLGS